MISLFYYNQLQFYCAKLLDTSEEDHQVSEFVNPVVDSDDEDDYIFEPERRFSGVFNTFVNQWCVKNDKNAFKPVFRFHAFPEILKMLETHEHEKFNFQQYCETKMLQTIVFSSNRKIKMPRNVLFRRSRKKQNAAKLRNYLKIPRNQNAAKIPCRQNFLP